MSHKIRLTEQVFTMIDCLYERGVSEMVISPGSRSTPLAIAAELHPHIKTYIHPDERSAAFFALGLYKGNAHAIAIICTSGTAASNYTPAVCEAYYSNVPLVVITADRPAELRNIGAPQTMNQTNMFQNFVQYYHELNVTNENTKDTSEVESVISHTAHYFNGVDQGPVHINVHIDEPLLPDLTRKDLFKREPIFKTETSTLADKTPIELNGRGIILLGGTTGNLDAAIAHLSQFNVPIFADPRQHQQSHHSVMTNHDLLFSYLLNNESDWIDTLDFVIRVGDPFTSKSTNQWLSQLPRTVAQLYFSEFTTLKTFPTLPSESYVGHVNERLSQLEIRDVDNQFNDAIKHMNTLITKTIEDQVGEFKDEGRFTYELLQQIPKSHVIFLSNSMPIRDVERYDIHNKHKIYANRGVNGIDGVTSTAIGMATHQQMTLIIGDLAFYHDMNGLLMSKLEGIDINIILFNNNGGGIFNFLPQYGEPEVFERLFGTPIDMTFEHAAQLYDFEYRRIDAIEDLSKIALDQGGRQIIEIMTDRTVNLNQHQALKELVFKAVKSANVNL